MKSFFHAQRLTTLILGGLVWGLVQAQPPAAAVRPVNDTYFGTTVTDPYRYMEDLAAPEVQDWAKAQSEYTRSVLDAIPGRAKLLGRIAALEAGGQSRVSSVRRLANGRYFYEKRGPNDNQFKLYTLDKLGGHEKLLVDPEALSKAAGGAPYAITFFSPSESGKWVAYGLSEGGSEEASIHVIDVATGQQRINPIDRAHYSEAAWMPDESGFFYLRQRELAKGTPETEKYRFQTSYFHRLQGQVADQAIVTAGETRGVDISPEEFPAVFPLSGTPWVGFIPGNGVQNEITLYVAPRSAVLGPGAKWRRLFQRADNITGFAIHGDDLYLLSHQGAPRYQVLRTRVSRPDIAHAEVVIPASQEVLVGINAARDGLYVQARDGTVGKLYRVPYGKGGKPVAVAVPREGSLEVASAIPQRPGLVIVMGSWTRDFGFYETDGRRPFADTGLQPLGPFSTPEGLVSKEVLVKSHDGVEVPMSIVHTKNLKLDGSNPTLLYGYGSYGITDDPVYLPRFLAWYELGGVRATCHVRGGGAFGEDWHLAGKLATKPNTWKDFIACGEYLVAQGYTTPAKLAIHGGSAGGILVGRAMTARPDLFAVAVPEVGVLNALRAETSANGVPNIPEFGTVKVEAQFKALLEMDALHHVVDGVKYPATMLIHGINDPRVPPWESLKMAARLQAATASGKPVLMRIDFASGHGLGSTKSQRQEQYADLWSFMLWQFGDPRFQPGN